MANPRVFISSTCYDLSEVRDSLVEFIQSFGFTPVLSEQGDVFYHPDIHTHDSCLNEVGNCELFILIIGGRFGGSYVADKTKSIVNAEYTAAKENKIPVFTFVKRGVHSDHHFYTKNKQKEHLGEMDFPAIDKREDAEKIFMFIDEVRRAHVNNGFFPFDFAREMTELLRKQWAGMFFEFLQERKFNDQNKITTNLLTNISDANEKVEELVKRLYRQLDETGADKAFQEVEELSIARKFIEDCYSYMRFGKTRIDPSISLSIFDQWYEYLANATGGRVDKDIHDLSIYWMHPNGTGHGRVIKYFGEDIPINEKLNEKLSHQNDEQQKRFEVTKRLPHGIIEKIIQEVSEIHHSR